MHLATITENGTESAVLVDPRRGVVRAADLGADGDLLELIRGGVVAKLAALAAEARVMPLQPGDIISPGTPGAIHVRSGDVAECRIPGVGTLRNDVVAG